MYSKLKSIANKKYIPGRKQIQKLLNKKFVKEFFSLTMKGYIAGPVINYIGKIFKYDVFDCILPLGVFAGAIELEIDGNLDGYIYSCWIGDINETNYKWREYF